MAKPVERNYGKLYDPDSKNTFVWHVVPKNFKSGTASSYVGTTTPSPQSLINQFVLVNPVQVGRYDEDGFYYTYKPPIEGVTPGKYVRVLQEHEIKDAKNQFERNRIYERHGVQGRALKV